ncbi:kinase-like domain-containing protein [Fomitopsis betulina]|nr:kinase-like domain-containing protein [Fomitopsis betulina]
MAKLVARRRARAWRVVHKAKLKPESGDVRPSTRDCLTSPRSLLMSENPEANIDEFQRRHTAVVQGDFKAVPLVLGRCTTDKVWHKCASFYSSAAPVSIGEQFSPLKHIAIDTAVSGTIAVFDAAGTVTPALAPAARVLSLIQKASEQIRGNKSQTERCDGRMLANKAAVLQDVIATVQVPDEAIRDVMTELETTLLRVHKRVSEWLQYSLVKAFCECDITPTTLPIDPAKVHRQRINAGIAMCASDIDVMLCKLQIVGPARYMEMNAQAMQQVQANQVALLEKVQEGKEHNEMRALSAMILQDPSSIREAAAMQHGGTQLLMEAHRHGSYTSEDERERIRKGLAQLQQLADILPAIKLLNGEVVCMGDRPVTSGSRHHEIWKGLWQRSVVVSLLLVVTHSRLTFSRKQVALKTLQGVCPQTSPRATKRLLREMKVQSRLKHVHVQGFFGITTDIGQFICIVTEWRSNGNLLQYAQRAQNANKLHLLSGAASGLTYLHGESVVHGNDEGQALICDFGMAKIVNDISDTFSAITDTLSKSASSRWMAPELIHEDNVELTFACDVWSFGMTMLELFTMDRPWAELKREAHVHRAMGDGDKPARPNHGGMLGKTRHQPTCDGYSHLQYTV